MSAENVEVVRRLYEATARHDSDAVLEFYDPEVEFDLTRARGWGPVTRQNVYRGHDGLRRVFGDWREVWDNLEENLDELIDAGDHVVSVMSTQARGRASGVEVGMSGYAGVWTVRDGRVVRIAWFESRADALAAAGVSG